MNSTHLYKIARLIQATYESETKSLETYLEDLEKGILAGIKLEQATEDIKEQLKTVFKGKIIDILEFCVKNHINFEYLWSKDSNPATHLIFEKLLLEDLFIVFFDRLFKDFGLLWSGGQHTFRFDTVFIDFITDYYYFLEALDLPVNLQKYLAVRGGVNVRLYLARNLNLDTDNIDILARDPEIHVRQMLVSNKILPDEIIIKLFQKETNQNVIDDLIAHQRHFFEKLDFNDFINLFNSKIEYANFSMILKYLEELHSLIPQESLKQILDDSTYFKYLSEYLFPNHINLYTTFLDPWLPELIQVHSMKPINLFFHLGKDFFKKVKDLDSIQQVLALAENELEVSIHEPVKVLQSLTEIVDFLTQYARQLEPSYSTEFIIAQLNHAENTFEDLDQYISNLDDPHDEDFIYALINLPDHMDYNQLIAKYLPEYLDYDNTHYERNLTWALEARNQKTRLLAQRLLEENLTEPNRKTPLVEFEKKYQLKG